MRTIYFFSFILFIFSCNIEKGGHSPYEIKEIKISHIGEIKFNGELLNPTSIIKQDSFFIISDIGTDTFFHIYGENSKNLINKVGIKGNGPDDFFNPCQIDIDRQNNSLTIFDNQLKLYREYKLTELINENKFKNSFSCKLPQRVSQAIYLSDYFVTIGAFEENMYGICKENTIIETKFNYPGKIELSDFKKSFIFDGKLRIKPDHTGLVYAGLYSDVIEIFKVKENKIDKTQTLYSYLPEYIDKSTNEIFKVNVRKEIPNGFNDIICTDQYIYAVYNGRTSIEHGYNHCWSDQIYILDWNGKMIKKIKLDKDIWSICIDDKNNKMYTISPNNKDENGSMVFYIYDLKNII